MLLKLYKFTLCIRFCFFNGDNIFFFFLIVTKTDISVCRASVEQQSLDSVNVIISFSLKGDFELGQFARTCQ